MEELSLIPTIIDYKRRDDSPDALIKQYCEDHKNILYSLYYHTLWRYSHSHIDRILDKERREYLHCSEPIYKESFSELNDKYDIYLTGSDQVWNKVGSGKTKEIDSAFFWDGLTSDSNVISYAASFGDSQLSDENFEKCKKWLAKYKRISVREDSGVVLLTNMGFDSTQVLDPTMIVDKQYWSSIADTSSIHEKQRYALIYNLHSNSNMYDCISKDLQNSNLKTYCITTTFRRGIGKTVFCPPIRDFLWLFKNASCIYADSFHAIAFSIIFNTPFVITLPKQYSTRLESILKLFELDGCLFEKKRGKGWEEGRINWQNVNRIMKEETTKSKEWLEHTIRMIKMK